MDAGAARRPLKSRQSRWAGAAAGWLTRRGVTPNAISVTSIGFATTAGACLIATRLTEGRPASTAALYVGAIVGMQGRLVCNLLDGMVAVEGGKAGPAGEVYNDLPDRIADPLVLACAGYAAGGEFGPPLGWLGAVLAVVTAYVRVLGRSLGAGIYFIGPMAKQHRMAVLTVACGVAAVAGFWARAGTVMTAALAVVVVGAVVTVARRTRLIVRDLEARR